MMNPLVNSDPGDENDYNEAHVFGYRMFDVMLCVFCNGITEHDDDCTREEDG